MSAEVQSTSSTPALSSVCSATITASTASAKRPPRASPSASASARFSPDAGGRRENAHGTTISEKNGAAAIPSATAVCPWAMPTATATANASREHASRNTSPP